MKVRDGFSLLELLTVLAIIVVLVGLLLPAVQAVREAAHAISCRNNLKQLGIALHGYHGAFNKFPSGVITERRDYRKGKHSGFVALLPFLEQNALYELYDFDSSWDLGTNRRLASVRIQVLQCPSSPNDVPQDGGLSGAPTHYAFSKGQLAFLCDESLPGRGMFDVNSQVQFADIIDGTSHTIALGDAASGSLLAARAP